ncbi:GIY-YIG nuclease family protein [Shewanella sp. GXUN23E]|uniref:GIY-YIG nuclease family protein n=1 Tax=Shewanella sp. GXUN23E TaxID=3422498 RepID=UPI003D7E504A
MAKRRLTVDGEVFCSLSDAARSYGLNPKLVQGRIDGGWTLEQSLELEDPPKKMPARRVAVKVSREFGGKEYATIKDAALDHGLEPKIVRSRINAHGWSIEEALGLTPREKRKAHNRKRVEFFIKGKKYSYESISSAAHAHGLNEFLVFGRLNGRGWNIKQALELVPPPKHMKRCFGYLYLITNNINGKRYVGQTMQKINARWEGHVKYASKINNPSRKSLSAAILRYGSDKFEIQKIDEASSHDELNKLERYWIKTLKTIAPEGYNLNRGGSGVNSGSPVTVEGKRYLSIADAARDFGLKERLVLDRLRYGWGIEQALEIEKPPKSHKYAGREIKIFHENETKKFSSIGELARYFNLPVATVMQRIVKLNWTPEQAVELVPPNKWVHPSHEFELEVNGELMKFRSKSEAAKHFGFKRWSTVQKRIDRGWSINQAIGLEVQPKNKFEKKEITVNIEGRKVIYKSQEEAAREHDISSKKVSARRKLGWSFEEALEIVPRNLG